MLSIQDKTTFQKFNSLQCGDMNRKSFALITSSEEVVTSLTFDHEIKPRYFLQSSELLERPICKHDKRHRYVANH